MANKTEQKAGLVGNVVEIPYLLNVDDTLKKLLKTEGRKMRRFLNNHVY